MKVGRPTLRTPELVDEFCNRIASARSIQSVASDPDMPEHSVIYRWRHESPEFHDKIALAREERKETTRTKQSDLGDRVLSDETLDPQRANAAAHAWAKAEAMSGPKTRVELTGKGGRPVSVADMPSLTVIARKVALAFRLAAMHAEGDAPMIEDASDGGD
jgi:hypothetical protein